MTTKIVLQKIFKGILHTWQRDRQIWEIRKK
jgi:hypothetical protein